MPRQLEDKLTPIAAGDVLMALRDAWRAIFSEDPKRESLVVLMAQSALETGRWKSCHCFNLGNIKSVDGDGRDYTFFRCNEVLNGRVVWFDPPHPACRFRAYETLQDGVRDYLETLRRRWARAWEAVEAGDPAEFVTRLKAARYFTADEGDYRRSVVSMFHEFMRLPWPTPEPPAAGWPWKPGGQWPDPAAVAATETPHAGETLASYIRRHGVFHFSAREVTMLRKRGVCVEPPREFWPRIVPTLRLAEILRDECGGMPLAIGNGYRPADYNAEVGGAPGSQHVVFRAVDIDLLARHRGDPDNQRILYHGAARLWSHYGHGLKMGLGFYSPIKGSRVHIDTGYACRSWEGSLVSDVVRHLGLQVP